MPPPLTRLEAERFAPGRGHKRERTSASPGHYIREWRNFRGMTQDEIAEKLQINKGLISKIERGVRRYNQDFLEQVAAVLKCRAFELIAGPPDEDRDILQHYLALGKDKRRDAVRLLSALSRS